VNALDDAHVINQKAFASYLTSRGVNLAVQEGIKVNDTDFAALATKIASIANLDCVYMSAFAPQSANLIRQLRQAGLDSTVKIIGDNALASPDFIAKGGTAVEGVYLYGDWAPGGASEEGRRFAAQFRERYGNPPDNWAAMGYSAMRVIATAIKSAGSNPTRDGVRAALAKSSDVPVVVGSGKFSLDAERVPHYGNVVLTIKNGQFVTAPN
jgi:branched-chain amino acid transport system substrate-binding protein